MAFFYYQGLINDHRIYGHLWNPVKMNKNKKNIFKSLFAVSGLLVATNVMAAGLDQERDRINSDRMIIDFSLDDNSDIHPDIYLPFKWNDNISAAVSYLSTADIDEGKVLGITDSLKNSEINYDTIHIFPALWKKQNTVMGIDIEILDITKQQSGYFVQSGLTHNFTHDLSIQVVKPAFYYQINKLKNKQNGFVYKMAVSPVSNLSVFQSSVFTGATTASGSADGDADSSLSFWLGLDARFKSDGGTQSYLDVRYEYLPMEYALDVLDASGSFTNEPYDVLEHILKITYKVEINKEIMMGFKPSFGFSYEYTDGENKNTGESYDSDKILFVFGIEG